MRKHTISTHVERAIVKLEKVERIETVAAEVCVHVCWHTNTSLVKAQDRLIYPCYKHNLLQSRTEINKIFLNYYVVTKKTGK
jgi:hypothetical protein